MNYDFYFYLQYDLLKQELQLLILLLLENQLLLIMVLQ